MSDFYADPAVGGDGSHTTDDNNASTGLGAGGYKTRLLPMLTQVVNIANWVKTNGAAYVVSALGYANAAAASATTAANAPGTSATSTTSMTIGTGAKSCTIQTGKLLVPGQYISVARTSAPQNSMDSRVDTYDSVTGALAFTSLSIHGSGTFTDWTIALVGAPAASVQSGSTSTALSAGQQVVLTASSTQVQRFTGTPGFGCSVKLPDATTMALKGSDTFSLVNETDVPIGLLNGANQVMGQWLPGDTLDIDCTDTASQAGAWNPNGNLDPWWQIAETGANLWASVQIKKIDDLKSLVFYGDVNGYPQVRYLSTPSDGSLALGAEYQLYAGSGSYQADVSAVAGNRMLVNISGQNFVIVDFTNGPTLSISGSITTTLTTFNSVLLNYGNNQHFIALGYTAAGAAIQAQCIDIGASGVGTAGLGSVATQSVSSLSSATFIAAYAVSATVMGVFHICNNGTYYDPYLQSITRTGTSLVWNARAAVPSGYNTTDTTQNSAAAVQVSGANYLWWYMSKSSPYAKYCVITFASSSSYNTPAGTLMTNINTSSPTLYMGKIGASAWISGCYAGGGTANLEVVTVSGTTPTPGNLTSVDAANGASGAYTPTLCSTVDGKGVINYPLGSPYNKTAFKGFYWNGSTLVLGTRWMPSSSSNQNPMSATSSSRNVAEVSGSVLRTTYATQNTSGSQDPIFSLAQISINNSGEVSFGGFTKPTEGSGMSWTGLDTNKFYGSNAMAGYITHGMYINGKFKLGRSTFKYPQNPDVLNSTTGGIYKLEQDHRPDRTCTIARIKFAEV